MSGHTKVLEIKFQDQESFRCFRSGIGQYIQETLCHLPVCKTYLFEAAVNEAINNALKHACVKNGKKLITVRLEVVDQKKLVASVEDNGMGFPGNQKLQELEERFIQDENSAVEECPAESGRGLLLMKSIADKVEYNAQGNEVMLIKSLY